jgi:hypothetical protein
MAKTDTIDLDNSAEAEPKPSKKPGRAGAGRPKKGEDRSIQKATRFFETLKKIPMSAWTEGNALVKVYRQEPCIDRTASGKSKHIQEYYLPFNSEERIKLDHGSGKYLLFLNYKGPKDTKLHEVETANIDILDMKYPPQVPAGDWLDEPKNKGWQWAFPKDPQQQNQRPSPAAEFAETLNALDEIQDRAIERAKPAEAPARESTLDIIKGVKEMMTPPAPATENKMLDTVVSLLTTQIQSAQQDNRELRKEIADMRNKPDENKGGLGSLTSIIGEVKGLLPNLKEMFPGLAEKAGTIARAARSNMTGDQEFWQPIVNRIVEAVTPAVPFFVQKMMTPSTPGNGAQPTAPSLLQPATPGAPSPAPGTPAPANGEPQPFNPAQAFEFLKQHAKPFLDWFKDGMPGGEFAESIFNLYGADWQGLPWLHAKQTFGAENIVAIFKKSPFWPEVATMEPAFVQFVTDFVKWQPGQEAAPEGDVIETTAQETGN